LKLLLIKVVFRNNKIKTVKIVAMPEEKHVDNWKERKALA
jgi:hypothetical protein